MKQIKACFSMMCYTHTNAIMTMLDYKTTPNIKYLKSIQQNEGFLTIKRSIRLP